MSKLSEVVEARRLPSPMRCRALRAETGLTLVELADQVGVSKTSVWLWERGDVSPRGKNRIAYAKALDELKGLL